MEIFRTWGVADAVRARAVPVDPDAATGRHPRRAAPLDAAAPAATRTCGRSCGSAPSCRWSAPRTWSSRSWPTPSGGTAARSGSARGSSDLQVRPDGVRARLGSGEHVRARFVVGADGTRSTVRAALGIGLRHLGTWAQAVQVLFRPDRDLGSRGRLPRLLTFVDEPQPAALCPMGAGRWGYVGLRFDGGRPDVPADWTATLRAATGLPDLAARGARRGAVHPGRGRRHRATGPGRASSSATPRTARPRSPASA